MTPQDLALRFALLKVLVAELSTAKKTADGEVRDCWRPGDRLTAVLPGGPDVGTVTLTKGKATAKVDNEIDFVEWARKVHPEWVETVKYDRVRPECVERLLSAARQLGVPVDAETGEEVPGITVTEGEPYPMVRLAAGAREAVAAAWQDGTLGELVAGLLAIEGGA